jgi:hypothetical protein
MPAKNVTNLSGILAMPIVEKGGPFGAPSVVGRMDGFPVAAGWTRNQRQNAVSYLIRFKPRSLRMEASAIATKIAESTEFLAAAGKKKLSPAERKLIRCGDDYLTLDIPFAFSAPSAETVAATLKVLLGIVKENASPLGTVCESCNATSADLYCVDGNPVSICSACREREGEEGRRRTDEYAAKAANPLMGTIAGVAACLIAAALWGGIAYGMERIFLMGAILIGFAIAWCVNRGMGKVNTYGRVLAIGLTLAAVIIGDYLFILLTTAREWGESVSAEMAGAVTQQFAAIEFSSGSSGWMSLFFAVIGAGYVLWTNRPPSLVRRMVPVTPSGA